MRTILIVLLISFSTFYSQPIYINEVMASNSIVLQDEDNEYSDWIELYNPTPDIINLSGFAISDDSAEPRKWVFPNIDIQPYNYLIVFASDKNKTTGELHTNFKISAAGEEIILTDAGEQIVDQLEPTPIPANISLGRSIDDPSQWLFYSDATPGSINNTEGYTAFSEEPVFSYEGGFYSGRISIELSSLSGTNDIYYTTDGSDPSTSSNIYTSPINIDQTKVIRARIFESGLLPSKTITNTYIIDENFPFPVISLSTNPPNLWDDYIGIYVEGENGILGACFDRPANWNQEWERPVHIEFFENNQSLAFSIDAGFAIHGNCSRAYPQKSFALHARGEYGNNEFPHQLFPNLPFDSYKSFILRNSGQDNNIANMRDGLFHILVEDINVEKQAYRPTIVFLNGEYWGIYYMREKTNEDYLANHYDIDPDNVDILKHSNNVVEGDSEHYVALLEYFTNNDLTISNNYEYIQTQMDVNCYINYLLTEMFIVNTDWYLGNMKFWRPKTIDGKWRWILFDLDKGFDLYKNGSVTRNMIDWVSNIDKEPSIIFNKLILNSEFKNKFINTFADLSNTIFKPDYILNKIDSLQSMLEPEMLRQFEKWAKEWQYARGLLYWYNQIDSLKKFPGNRLPIMQNHFITDFDIGQITDISLSVNSINYGDIKLNTLNLSSFPWSGEYFQGLPVTIEAIPKPGYRFSGWSGSIESTDRIITYTPSSANNIAAIFVEDNQTYPVVINEINYHVPDAEGEDAERPDWIELYNNSDNAIDLSGWQFNDEGNTFIFPNGTSIGGRSYLVLAENVSDFQFYYSDVTNLINGNLGFGLSNGGEEIALYSLNGTLVDTVDYNDKAPWPIEPDGNGPTLELIHPELDNSIAENWRSSNLGGFGTPGKINDSYFDIHNPTEVPKIVINEINYNSPDVLPERPDWIELYNNSDYTVDLSDWEFKDEENTFLIPSGTTLNSGDYLVLTESIANFQDYYPSVSKVLTEEFGFGLSGGGELLRLYNPDEILVDKVEYTDDPPWPIEADGNGPTLELKHPDLDNELAVNWSPSLYNYGTPGTENGSVIDKFEISLRIYLEGAYESSSNMAGTISQIENFPLTQPYGAVPWNYEGLQSISELPNENIVDWVLVELRKEINSESVASRKAGLLKSNGNIVDVDGESELGFWNLDAGDYYVTVYHRNHLPVMSSVKITISE